MVRSTRSSYACARCYKRKKKCDRRYPSCSQCVSAKAQCSGLDRGSEEEVPRSLVSFLEDTVAQLELERNSININVPAEAPNSGFGLLPTGTETTHFDAAAAYAVASRAAQDSAPAVNLNRDSRLPLPYYRAFFLGAELPFPLAFQEKRSVNVPPVLHDESAAVQLPAEVSDQLMNVYVDRILPQYPLFLKQEVIDMFERFKASGQERIGHVMSADEHFIVSMIMAVATMTSKARDYRKLVSVAESLRRDAFARLDLSLGCNKATTTTIQQLLLLVQYGFLLPSSTNLWQVVGDATRIALELGLHRDTPEESGLSDSARACRRRIYWTLYALERSVAITSHRPFAVAGDQVHLSVPLQQGDPGFPDQPPDQVATDASQEPHVPLSSNILFLRLQSEICSANIGMRPIPHIHFSYQDWLIDVERRVNDISAGSPGNKRSVLMECHTLLILHMPCARNPTPDHSSVVKYFDAAVRMTKGYWDLIESNDLDNPWHATHQCYEAGILILYGLCHHRAIIQRHYSMVKVFEVVHQVSGLFILLVRQWPAAHQCGLLFDRLRKWALTYFREDGPPDSASPSFEARQLKDLVFRENADLLYAREQPTTALGGQSAFDYMFPNFEIDPLSLADSADLLGFFNLFGPGELEDFSPTLPDDDTTQPGFLDAPVTVEASAFALSSQSPSRSFDREQLSVAIEKLPVCSQCKKRRVKCDTDLPACKNCKRLRRDCSYWDNALGEEVTRKHIHALSQHAKSLISEVEMPPSLLDTTLLPSTGAASRLGVGVESSRGQVVSNVLCTTNSGDTLDLVHFGATSSFCRLANQIGNSATFMEAAATTPPTLNSLENLCGSFVFDVTGDLPRIEAEKLAWLYFRSIETTYPILGRDLVKDTLDQVYDLEKSMDTDDVEHAATRTRFYLILAISLALLGARESRLELAADAYFRKAISLGSSSDQFIHPSRQSLQMMLLLCIYAWIRPSSLDIWRLLGHASRMCLDIIEVHGSGRDDPADSGVPYRTIYTLETQVAISLGRPSQLPNGQDIPIHGADPGSSTTGDIPTMVYNLARLESRFHRLIMANSSDTSSHHTWMAGCVQDMKTWIDDWNMQIQSVFPGNSTSPREGLDLQGPLQQYGLFKQAEALLLAKLVTDNHGNLLISSDEEIAACKQLVRAASNLLLPSTTTTTERQMSFIFGLTWTRAHAVFTATVTLMHYAQGGTLLDAEAQECARLGVEILASTAAYRADNAGLLRYNERLHQLGSTMSLMPMVE